MASTYTTNLGIEKIGTGEQSGTWGDTTNTNFDLIDEAVNGIISITLSSAGSSGSPTALPIAEGSSSNGRNKFIEFVDGGDLGGTAYVQLTPNDAEKIVHIRNSLSGSRSVIVFQGTYNASNDFEIANGADVLLKFNGGGSGATVTDVNVDFTVTGLTATTANATTVDTTNLEVTNIKAKDGTSAGSIADSTGVVTLASSVLTTTDINGGTIDGAVIGGASAAAITATTITGTTITASTAVVPDASDGATLGSTSLEWSDLYLADGAVVFFGDDQDITLTHVADTGLTLKHANTGDDKFPTFLLATGDTDIAADDKLGVINFQAPDEGAGTDAILVAAGIEAVSEGDFSASSNATSLVFKTGASEAAAEKFRVTSAGNVGIGTSSPSRKLDIEDTSANPVASLVSSTSGTPSIFFGDTDNDARGRIEYENSNDKMRIYSAGSNRVSIDSSGFVGIGTNSPTATLDVDGTIKLDGNYPVGTGNVALGDTALDSVTSSGSFNVAIGRNALTACTSGDSNVAVGNSALSSLTTIAYNTAVGHAALLTTETGAYNTAIGAFSQEDTTTGARNTAVGYGSLRNNTEGERNTTVGYAAMSNNTTGGYNEAFGYSALGTATTASYNTAMGYAALYSSNGSYNVAVGYTSLYDNTSGIYNNALGYSSLANNTDGNYNTAIGASALLTPTGADHNTALGYAAGYSCTTGGTNICIGNYSGYTSSTSSYNVFVGYQAGYNNTTGSGHTCVGYLAGNNFSAAGSYGNTCIGYNAETGADTHYNSIVMGYNTAGVGSGYFTFGTGTGNDRVYNQFGANASWTRVSDQRYKKDIQDNTDCGLAFINDLRPVTFKWKAKSEIDNTLPDYDADKTEAEYASKMYGLIAQEVKQALDKHNITDFGGWHETEDSGIQGVSQEMFIYPLIKAVQELSAKVTALESGG